MGGKSSASALLRLSHVARGTLILGLDFHGCHVQRGTLFLAYVYIRFLRSTPADDVLPRQSGCPTTLVPRRICKLEVVAPLQAVPS